MMDWERLISDYFDDALSPEDVAALFQWIKRRPDNARQFARAAFMHRQLQHHLSAMGLLQEGAGLARADLGQPPTQGTGSAASMAEPSPPAPTLPAPAPLAQRRTPKPSRTWWRLGASAAAAALLIMGVLWFLAWPQMAPARLVAEEHATWEPGASAPQKGDRLPKRSLVLNSGFVKIAFDNGNQVIIQGPARFTVADAGVLTFDQGRLTAVVTGAGRGFCVSTPTAQITDFGTEFGVQAAAAATRVAVFKGKVQVAGSGGSAISQELTAGSAVEVSTAGILPVPFAPELFTRFLPSYPAALDLVDLLAGGDGTGSAAGVGIDAATGRTHETRAVTGRLGNHQFVRADVQGIVDGCFIPGGRMPVDSAGHLFTFPATSNFSYGLIWTGPDIPWEGELPIATALPQDLGNASARVLVMHSNNGFTLNLDAIRALHASAPITGFRARVGNSYRPAAPDALPASSLASIHVIVDGIARFEKRAFANTDAPIDVTCTLTESDHFLTLATTDGGDGNSCDWVLWTNPELLVKNRVP
jgi:ferric-dicitrate binding protein FerR (iron transport regulator)